MQIAKRMAYQHIAVSLLRWSQMNLPIFVFLFLFCILMAAMMNVLSYTLNFCVDLNSRLLIFWSHSILLIFKFRFLVFEVWILIFWWWRRVMRKFLLNLKSKCLTKLRLLSDAFTSQSEISILFLIFVFFYFWIRWWEIADGRTEIDAVLIVCPFRYGTSLSLINLNKFLLFFDLIWIVLRWWCCSIMSGHMRFVSDY